MRRVLKAGAVLLAVLALIGTAVVAALFLGAAKPDHPVGFTSVAIPDPRDQPLEVGIWYPTDSPSARTLIGLSTQVVAPDGNVAGTKLPLVVISHGNRGLLSSHSDTALALASAGFVVAAVTHTGDNARDDSAVGTARWLTDRPRHLHVVVDYILHDWPAHARVDPARVGVFGFSAGGFAALVAVGGAPDLARIDAHCRVQAEIACALWRERPSVTVPAAEWVHDARIKAAVVAAPGYAFAFEPDGLSRVTAPVQLWNGAEDGNVPYATNAAVVQRLLPSPPDYHAVPGAGHFAFLAPCPAWLMPAICKDADGFDRAAFHAEFNRSVVRFYQERLGTDAS